jgi:hypothetical protein
MNEKCLAIVFKPFPMPQVHGRFLVAGPGTRIVVVDYDPRTNKFTHPYGNAVEAKPEFVSSAINVYRALGMYPVCKWTHWASVNVPAEVLTYSATEKYLG